MKDIFISYKSEEYNTAKWVRDYLEKCGLSIWMAPEDIHGGGSYAEYIPDEENDEEDIELDEDPTEEELEAISNGDIEGDEI